MVMGIGEGGLSYATVLSPVLSYSQPWDRLAILSDIRVIGADAPEPPARRVTVHVIPHVIKSPS